MNKYKLAKHKWFKERVKSASFYYEQNKIAEYQTDSGFLRSLNFWEFRMYFYTDWQEVITKFVKRQNRFKSNSEIFFNLRKICLKNKLFWLDVEKERNQKKFSLEEKRILKEVGLISK